MCKLVGALLCLLMVAACQTRPMTAATATNLFERVIAERPKAADLPPYAELYQSYLQSSIVHVTANEWQQLQEQATDQQDCRTLPWQSMLTSQFWSLSFYQQALRCFDTHQMTAEQQQFGDYQQYVLSGILASGNGQSAFSAYQINSYADSHALSQLLALQTLDFYAELSADNNALHYVFQVFDPTEQRFKTVYFENQRYLHAIDQIPFPFMGLVDGWRDLLNERHAGHHHVLMLAWANEAAKHQKLDEAIELYQRAIAQGSAQAAVKLAELCLQQQLPLTPYQCQQWLLEAADHEYLPALHLLNFLHHAGQVPNTTAEKKQQLQVHINAMAGAGQAELQLSRYFFKPEFKQADRALAELWLSKATAAGQPEALAFFTLLQFEKQQITQQELLTALEQQANAGHTVAAYLLGAQLIELPIISAQQAEIAKRVLEQATLNWHPEAFYLLAYGYERGIFTPQNPQAIALLYQQAAQKLYPRAMARVAAMLRDGEGMPKDSLQASRWFLLCSKQGHIGCAYQAGVMFDDGDGIEQNYQNAWRFFSFAAEKGYPPAMNRLALLYLFGKGVETNPSKAIQLFTQAAAQGSASASYYLGLLYLEGKEIPQDLNKAKAFFEQAAKHPNARRYLDNWEQVIQQQQQTK